MSGSMSCNFHPDRIRYCTHSLWTRARQSCCRLQITVEGNQPCSAKNACTFLHRVQQECESQSLMELPDQGKVARALAADIHGNGSSWLYNCLNMRFSDWRFIHRARLNLVPTNQNKSVWKPDESSTCRKCHTTTETLPHILCHCPPNMVPIRVRHNNILGRLTKAV